MKKKRVGFFSGLDFVTFITALIGSCYGLALVYSATFSTLKNGAIIASGVKSMLISPWVALFLRLLYAILTMKLYLSFGQLCGRLYWAYGDYSAFR